ncbi:MAG: NAD(P)-binding domain-containing protein, partial [Candidatus Puniceispirillaceae bacterium]
MNLNAAETPLNENSKLGFIGLGNMGAALAMRLLAPNLMVFDPNPVHMAPFIDGGAMAGADA